MGAFDVLLQHPKMARKLVDNVVPSTVETTIAIAQIHALLAIAEAIYESSGHEDIAKAIEEGFRELAMETARG